MKSGIYKIENNQNGKVYIGSAVNLHERMKNHRTRLNCGIHKNRHLQSAWNKSGADAFKFATLLFCSPDNLLFYEQRCIDRFDAVEGGYNINPIAGNARGRAPNPERIAKMAATKRGKKQSPEHVAARMAGMVRTGGRARISAAVSAALKGRPKSAEHARKVALAQIGKVISVQMREKLRMANLGKINGPHSDATRLKISAAQKGRPLKPEHVAALKAAWVGRKARMLSKLA